MPEPLTNNAVARLRQNGDTYLYSFNGLRAGKTPADVTATAWEYDTSRDRWRRLPDVPGEWGRLASVAVGLGNRVLIFGGYTVGADGSEVSTPEVYAFDPDDDGYRTLAPMPTPVDDAVAVAYRDRYVYLISGWHDTGNVRLVQVYDAEEDRWFRASDYPGAPVFGHAGGIVGNVMVIAGGVKVVAKRGADRRFAISGEAFLGEIDASDPARINWRPLPAHEGPLLYRAAAAGVAERNLVVFAGGSANPYNYNGVGYDGEPSDPVRTVLAFDLKAGVWLALGERRRATMDHRGLLVVADRLCTLGGMAGAQRVTGDLFCFRLP